MFLENMNTEEARKKYKYLLNSNIGFGVYYSGCSVMACDYSICIVVVVVYRLVIL